MITSVHFCLPLLFSKSILIISSSSSSLFIFSLFTLFISSYLILDIQNFLQFYKTVARNHIQFVFSFVKHNYLHLHCVLHLFIFFTSSAYYIIKQLLTISPRSILVFSGRHHIMSNAPIVNNCIMSISTFPNISQVAIATRVLIRLEQKKKYNYSLPRPIYAICEFW